MIHTFGWPIGIMDLTQGFDEASANEKRHC